MAIDSNTRPTRAGSNPYTEGCRPCQSIPQYVVAEGKPVVHLTTGEILVSLAQILPIAVNGIQGINDFLHMIPC